MNKASTVPPRDRRRLRATAARVIEDVLGAPPRRVTSQPGGASNFVFRVDHPEGEFIVRLGPAPDSLERFRKEQWAVAQARGAGVPTADIIVVGDSAVGQPYMVSRRTPGQEASLHPERLSILREMGRVAARVHSVATTGYGHLTRQVDGSFTGRATWRDFLESEIALPARLEILATHAMLPAATIAELRAILEAGPDADLSPVLNHGDLRLKNVLVDEAGKLSALIDWEHSLSMVAPAWEFALALHDLSIDDKQEFLRGYGASGAQLRDTARFTKALNLINYAPYVERHAADAEWLERCRVRLSGALDLYSL